MVGGVPESCPSCRGADRGMILAVASAAASACGVPKVAHRCSPAALRGSFVFVDHAPEKPLSLDPLSVEVCRGVGGPRWAKLARTVRPSTVVVPDVLCEHGPQMPLVEDQHTIGEFGSGCQHEPLGVAVGPWTTRRNPSTRSPSATTRLRICCVVHLPSGFVVVPRTWT